MKKRPFRAVLGVWDSHLEEIMKHLDLATVALPLLSIGLKRPKERAVSKDRMGVGGREKEK